MACGDRQIRGYPKHTSVTLTYRPFLEGAARATSGAYWEAGFGEGLGLPVIYTCEISKWAESKTHFDTNHLVTIIWDPGDLQKAQIR